MVILTHHLVIFQCDPIIWVGACVYIYQANHAILAFVMIINVSYTYAQSKHLCGCERHAGGQKRSCNTKFTQVNN